MTGGQPRDWDKEMAEIDKIMAKSPPAQLTERSSAAGPPTAVAPARSAPVASSTGRRAALATWLRVGLGVALAAGMTQWPYFHACGTALFLYLGALGMVGLSGVWGMITSWRHRMGLAHTISILVLLWGGILAAATVLPRNGYARLTATWMCP